MTLLPLLPCVRSKRHRVYRSTRPHVDVLLAYTGTFWTYTRGFFSVSPHTTTTTATHNNDNDNETQRQQQRRRHTTPTKTTMTTNLQLYWTQQAKTHQVQTQQGLTDSSFLMLWWWCMAVFSVGEVVCFAYDRDLSLLNHVKYDSYLITSQRDRSRTHP